MRAMIRPSGLVPPRRVAGPDTPLLFGEGKMIQASFPSDFKKSGIKRTAAAVAIAKIHDCIEAGTPSLVWARLSTDSRIMWLNWCVMHPDNANRNWGDFNTSERFELTRSIALRVEFFAMAGMDHLKARAAL